MTDVQVERARLDDGVPVMYRTTGERIRLAFDPRQISESAAIALLCVHMPQLIGTLRVSRVHPAGPAADVLADRPSRLRPSGQSCG